MLHARSFDVCDRASSAVAFVFTLAHKKAQHRKKSDSTCMSHTVLYAYNLTNLACYNMHVSVCAHAYM